MIAVDGQPCIYCAVKSKISSPLEQLSSYGKSGNDVLHKVLALIISGLVTNGTAKICCLGLILALFYSTMVIKSDF